jgi:hypothetical protein
MGARSQVLYTTGASGSGKTLRRGPWFVCRELLPNSDSVHVSNFPWRFDVWTDGAGIEREGLVGYMARHGVDEDVVRDRVRCIPESVTDEWRNAGLKDGEPVRGPWDTFKDEDMSGWHLAIDEIHNYVPKSGPGCRRIQAAWSKWLGELRHRGATIEFLSQSPAKVGTCIENEAEIRLELLNNSQRYDPFFRVKMYYWYQLQAKLTGYYRPGCWQIELRQISGKWKEQDSSPFWFDDSLFACYDSWSAPIAGGKKGTSGKHPYQVHSLPGLLFWFWRENVWTLTWRPAALFLLLLSLWHRGALMDRYFKTLSLARPGASAPKGAKSAEVASPASGKTVVGGDGAELLKSRIGFLEDKLDEARGEAEAREAELTGLKARVDEAFALASLTYDQVNFRGGYTYAIGELIDWGPYEGKRVVRIDFARRAVVLDDGRVLRMGAGDAIGWLQGATGAVDKAAGAAGVPNTLSGAGVRAVGQAGASVLKRKGDGERKRDANGPIRAVAREPNRGFDSGGNELGSGAGDSGVSGADR